MEFTKIDVQNFKKFKSCHLEFRPGVNILLGEKVSVKLQFSRRFLLL